MRFFFSLEKGELACAFLYIACNVIFPSGAVAAIGK